jgi:hypothetical protein
MRQDEFHHVRSLLLWVVGGQSETISNRSNGGVNHATVIERRWVALGTCWFRPFTELYIVVPSALLLLVSVKIIFQKTITE